MTEYSADDILELINGRENKDVDYKISIDISKQKTKKDLAIDAISFANAKGGLIIVGVKDKTKEMIGLSAPLDHDRIIQSITNSTYPPVDAYVDTETINDKLIGIIRFQPGKAVHRLQNQDVYIRRDGINYRATPEEIVRLADERDYLSRVYLSDSFELYSSDNKAILLSGEEKPYRKVKKTGGLTNLAECPVFLPEFSRWTPVPEFGITRGMLMINYQGFDHIRHDNFIDKVSEVENLLNRLNRYIDNGMQGVLNWSISSFGTVCYGCGSDTLFQAFEDGELGAITICACGDFRGASHQRSFLLLISGYCKSKEGNFTLVQDWEINIYLSTIPITHGWIRALFSPFLNEDDFPFTLSSYELVHPRFRVWRPINRSNVTVPIKGTIGRYKYIRDPKLIMGAAIANTNWFNPRLYKLDVEWKRNHSNQDLASIERAWSTIDIENETRVSGCPVKLIDECVVSLTNPVPLFEDIDSGEISHFHPPLIKHLELGVIGHNVHVIGLNASPRING